MIKMILEFIQYAKLKKLILQDIKMVISFNEILTLMILFNGKNLIKL
jgi:hypothetical protein